MTRSHPIIALDSRRRHNHYADFHRARQGYDLDIYYTALRHAEHRANLKYEQQSIHAMLEHKLFRPGTKLFLESRRRDLASQIHNSLGHM